MRSKFLAFFRENPVLLLVPAAVAFFLLFWNPENRIELSHDPESWFDKQPKIELQFGGSRIHLHSNGTWRVRGSELFLDGQTNELGRPIDLSGSRLSDHGSHLQLVLPNGKTQLLRPVRD